MGKLVFMNMTLDQKLDLEQNLKKIFPSRIPSSEKLVRLNEDYGIFLSSPGDVVLQANEFSSVLRERFSKRGIYFGKEYCIASHPFDESEWFSEFAALSIKASDFECFGSGPLEQRIFAELEKSHRTIISHPKLLSLAKASELNAKAYLIQKASDWKLNIPESRVLTQRELGPIMQQAPEDEYILKANWASGGGGNFLVNANNRRLLQRFEDLIAPDFVWILQKYHSKFREWSVVASTEDSRFQLVQIQYDQKGLSFEHQAFVDPTLSNEYEPLLEAIRKDLRQQGYEGDFGCDGFQNLAGTIFPVIDLNVRKTKAHLIALALDKLHFSKYAVVSRHRWKGIFPQNSEDWLAEYYKRSNQKKLNSEILLSGGITGNGPGILELTFAAPDSEDLKTAKSLLVQTLT